MLDATTEGSTPTPRCNWCSAPLLSDHEVTCPSCGATLLGDGETSAVPGLTAIDAEAILRNARAVKAKPRGRLLSWISGDYDEGSATTAAAPGSLAPPTGDVRREMLRLELEAQLTNAQAEVESLVADAAVEEGRSLEPLAATPHAEAEAVAEAVAVDDDIGAVDTHANRSDAQVDRDEAPPA
ncbi:MAG: hypothetical protein H0U52_10050 [Chloroflexi bacterium]|nr:hypothetical protein [Chloroflexota bacterium]